MSSDDTESFGTALITVIAYSNPVHAASFDCRAATTAVEKMVCSDGTLSKLDEELARVYTQALVEAPDRNALKKEQREWVKKERDKCNSRSCLFTCYKNRIEKCAVSMEGRTGNQIVRNKYLFGKWESYGTAFYQTGVIEITPMFLAHESCKTKFHLLNQNQKEYYFEAQAKNTCYTFSIKNSLNYIKVISEGDNEITVRYYSATTEGSLLGEGTYNKVN